MADKISTGVDAKINFGFADGDTRLVTLQHYKTSTTAQQVYNVSQTLKNNQFLVGDKAGAVLIGILTLDKYEYTTTEFDFENQ